MTNINKTGLNNNFKDAAWKEFLSRLKKVKSEEDFKKLIKEFLVLDEQVILEKRLLIRYLLKQNLSYRAIGEIIDVGPKTISFVKNGLKNRKAREDKKNKSIIKTTTVKKQPWYPTFTGRGRWRFLNRY